MVNNDHMANKMNFTEFVQKHGDPSRPGYAAQHPDSPVATGRTPSGAKMQPTREKKLLGTAGQVKGKNAPDKAIARAVYQDDKANGLAEDAKLQATGIDMKQPASQLNAKLTRVANTHQAVANRMGELIDASIKRGNDPKRDPFIPDQMKAKKWYEAKAKQYQALANANPNPFA